MKLKVYQLHLLLNYTLAIHCWLSKEDVETLQVFKDSITAENREVATLWKSAKDKKYNSEDVKSAQVVDELDDNLPDPAEMLSA